tara:strand:- start:5900 stop:6019 length:120 start_codon:yes stop_codon:yes gene_type:complete
MSIKQTSNQASKQLGKQANNKMLSDCYDCFDCPALIALL